MKVTGSGKYDQMLQDPKDVSEFFRVLQDGTGLGKNDIGLVIVTKGVKGSWNCGWRSYIILVVCCRVVQVLEDQVNTRTCPCRCF